MRNIFYFNILGKNQGALGLFDKLDKRKVQKSPKSQLYKQQY